MAMAGGTMLLLASCGIGGGGGVEPAAGPGAARAGPVSDYPVKIGEPYQVEGVTYTPEDVFNYDEVGYASWYGQEMAGRRTANGEIFDPNGITGAHRTLPLPSYVEVTALDTGRTILVRLNDRGPFSKTRLIDLSYGAARQLGIVDQGSAAVRVRRVNPPEQERAELREGRAVAERLETPEPLLLALRKKLEGKPKPTALAGRTAPGTAVAPPPKGQAPASAPPAGERSGRFIVEQADGRKVPMQVENGTGDNRATLPPAAASEGYVVQVAAFSSKARADALAGRIGARVFASADNSVYRVRYGPFANASDAEEGLNLARRNGYDGARILKSDGD